ncbi:dienelactone hydrolase family protein [bacterium]|nr:dienelactone hydrolase family protein [bacterium]
MEKKSFHFTNSILKLIKADFYQGKESSPLIFVCHGFKGFKDWGMFPYVCERLSKIGFNVISFNFSLNGIENNLENFTNLDNFRINTYSREILDLEEIVSYVTKNGKFLPELQNLRYGFLGHSRGGGISLLASKILEPKSIVTWSAIDSVMRFSTEDISNFEQKGFTEVLNARTKQLMPISKDLFFDAKAIHSHGDIEGALKTTKIPLLLIHGESDFVVPLENWKKIVPNLKKAKTTFKIIPNGDHTFGAVHPFKQTTNELEQAIELTSDWFKKYL